MWQEAENVWQCLDAGLQRVRREIRNRARLCYSLHLGLAPKCAEAHAKAVPVDEGIKRAAALASRAGEAAYAANARVKVCTNYTSKSTRLSCKYTHSSFPALNACVFVCVLVQDHLVNAYADIRYNKMFSSTAVQSYFCSGRIPLQNSWERR